MACIRRIAAPSPWWLSPADGRDLEWPVVPVMADRVPQEAIPQLHARPGRHRLEVAVKDQQEVDQ